MLAYCRLQWIQKSKKQRSWRSLISVSPYGHLFLPLSSHSFLTHLRKCCHFSLSTPILFFYYGSGYKLKLCFETWNKFCLIRRNLRDLHKDPSPLPPLPPPNRCLFAMKAQSSPLGKIQSMDRKQLMGWILVMDNVRLQGSGMKV